ncbi:class I SAM-dependent methyltransferase [Roseovarius nubinhibens]|uniref:methyltransferase domain-containing protein n=1 Tax=Roseovarius nubinhibens TaxID=314263 RepID=UPI001C0A03BB|nr:methyltransferase domain-containing protein [Roseovarius nubinhibens]MBU3000751.1 class I SAM-dependent methyltransferase [Roseovarius nubinhibens]
MGVDVALFDRLVELSTRFQPRGRTLMLGRQGFTIQTRHRKAYDESLARHGIDARRFDFLQEDGFAETLMEKLGFGQIETMDFSDYEGAAILHDLNKKPERKLWNQFDFIFDGGTVEHVFNVPMALEGLYRMLKPGGRLVSANGLNGWYGHGMYQFNPELVWTFWRRACNCNVIDCRAVPVDPDDEFGQVEFRDPAETGVRLKLKNQIGPGRTYLYYEVEKTKESHLPDFALQSDYETRWNGHENAGATHLETETRT